MKKVSREESRLEAFHRVAYVLQSLWKSGGWAHTRFIDYIVREEDVLIGESERGTGHREHLVPCSWIINTAFEMYDQDASIEEVTGMVSKCLRIAYISKDEAKKIDCELGYKTTMPDGWSWKTDSVTARLDVAGIKLRTDE